MSEYKEAIAAVLIIVTFLALFIGGFALIAPRVEAERARQHEERVALCMRAYEFSRDRCEFILSNGGRDLK